MIARRHMLGDTVLVSRGSFEEKRHSHRRHQDQQLFEGKHPKSPGDDTAKRPGRPPSKLCHQHMNSKSYRSHSSPKAVRMGRATRDRDRPSTKASASNPT